MSEGYQGFPGVEVWRGIPFDDASYRLRATLLDEAREAATEEAREHAVQTAIRYAGTDTGAIEGLCVTDRGFTRSVAIQAAAWQAVAREKGPKVDQVIEDQIEAYEWVLDLATKARPVTEQHIKDLHAILCRHQDVYVVETEVGRQERPLPWGEYKKFPNNPTNTTTGRVHHYAPPDDVPSEMHRLVEAMGSNDLLHLPAVVQAAFIHFAFVTIHPFADGNGRVARALASVPLYRDARVPLLIFSDQRDEYLDALEAADDGHLGPFLAFVLERTTDAMELVRFTVRLGPASDRERSIEALRRAVTRADGLDSTELDAIAATTTEVVRDALDGALADLELPPDIVTEVTLWHGDYGLDAPGGYRTQATPQHLSVRLRLPAPSPASIYTRVQVMLPIRPNDLDVSVVTDLSEVPPLELPVREVHPVIREIARLKIADWVGRLVDTLVAAVASMIDADG